jgi:small-conductance mechanosensitive channel
VEKIGIKTTRIKALQGEEIVLSNKDLISAQIQNFKKMASRRVVFNFGVTYDTANSKLEKIPTLVKNIFNAIEIANLDRVHFARFDDSALSFETVYFIATADYNLYMDTQQEINLGIKKAGTGSAGFSGRLSLTSVSR